MRGAKGGGGRGRGRKLSFPFILYISRPKTLCRSANPLRWVVVMVVGCGDCTFFLYCTLSFSNASRPAMYHRSLPPHAHARTHKNNITQWILSYNIILCRRETSVRACERASTTRHYSRWNSRTNAGAGEPREIGGDGSSVERGSSPGVLHVEPIIVTHSTSAVHDPYASAEV